MFPIIFKIGPFTIFSYGLMLAVAVVVCTIFMSREAKRLGIKPQLVSDLIFWLVIGGVVGARIFFIILHFEFFKNDLREMFMIQHGGLSWQGGLIFGMITGVIFIKKHKLNFPKMLDLSAPYVALGQSIGRVGCFLNGCCYGLKSESYGWFFPVHNAKIIPIQLMASLSLFMIFLFLKKIQSAEAMPGRVFVVYLILAAGLRFIIEFFRDDHVTLFMGLSVFQFVCMGLFAIALLLLNYLKRKNVS